MRNMSSVMILVAALQTPGAGAYAQTASTQNSATSNSLERNVDSGASVRMDLEAGDYEIRGGTQNKIHVRWQARTPEKLAEAKVIVDAQGRQATIKVRRPGGSNADFKVLIELPARADVFVRLSAGDLRMKGIEGSKDVELHAGDLDMDIGDPASYGAIDASVKAGDLNAEAFHVSKGGLFRHFRQQGKGSYRLHAHVGAGDLRLHGSKSTSEPVDGIVRHRSRPLPDKDVLARC